jgi:hypothetical protein
MNTRRTIFLSGMALGIASLTPLRAADALEAGFASPPREAKLRAYWWWLNGNVTKESITRDLEGMAEKGFGGALICDAGGAEQDGNDKVPHGPTFLTPEWRELYKHALREADRLGLEMSLNIQSGWNLGRPTVKPEEAPKRVVWSEARITGPAKVSQKLKEPQHPAEFYRDIAVLAYPVKKSGTGGPTLTAVLASSEQAGHLAKDAVDGSPNSFWVSGGLKPGQGPSRKHPEWLQLDFAAPIEVNALTLLGRPGFGPHDCELQASDDGKTWRTLKTFAAEKDAETRVAFDATQAAHYRLTVYGSFDPTYPTKPRNAQILEFKLAGPKGTFPAEAAVAHHVQLWQEKALEHALGSSAPDTSALLKDLPNTPGEEDLHTPDVIDLTGKFAKDGTLAWDAPAGDWQVLRFGCTLNQHCRVSTCSDGWAGYALDPFDADAFNAYWRAVVDPLIADAGPLAGGALKYLHTDSWEVEVANWTPTLREEFRRRRGYDLWPFLPALTGRIVDNRDITNRFLHDLRKTMGELAIDNHYRLFSEYAHKHNLLLHPESGGPHSVPIDSLRCLGMNDAPMSEFWARSWRHRVTEDARFFVKQPATAAHTYGRKLVLAEGFTTIGPHWQETLWDNLKPTFDRACCEGLNLLVWHAFVCSPESMGVPGQQYFAGTHLNPLVTWWPKSAAFFAYINRCQFLLQQGLFVADAVYYYGDNVPNFTQLKPSDPARVQPGYDYDVATEEVVLTRMAVRDGRIVLPDGMSYRVLVLPNFRAISLPVLRKVKEIVEAGATVIGPKPEAATGLSGYPDNDKEVAMLAAELWGEGDGKGATERRVGKGRVITGRTAREVLQADGVAPDFGFAVDGSKPATTQTDKAATPAVLLDYIHRRTDGAEIYFVSNQTDREVSASASFRVNGKATELWDAVSGGIRALPVWTERDNQTVVPLHFAPYGSCFVVFRRPAAIKANVPGATNFPAYTKIADMAGPWKVEFDPRWGGPASVEFSELVSWSKRPEPGIRYYSGTAVYVKTFDVPSDISNAKSQISNGDSQTSNGHTQTSNGKSEISNGGSEISGGPGRQLYLNLGLVRELAEVRLNGKSLGVLWAQPFRVDITDAVKPTGNELEIEVVNFWPNRIIGDAALPPDQRLTRTNIKKLTKNTPLMDAGLLGPVTIETVKP